MEIKPIKKAKEKKLKKELKEITNDKEDIVKIKERRKTFEMVIFIVIAVFFLILLCNKTFFKETYKKDNINIEMPMFMYYVHDKDEELKLITLRKSDYIKEYFDNYLTTLDKYTCKSGDFYYDNNNKIAVYNIDVKKNFGLKTVKIKYKEGSPDDLCISNESYIIIDNKLEAAIPE